MNRWDYIRKQARHFHREACAYGDDEFSPGAAADLLLAKAERMTGIRRRALPHKHPQLDGAVAKFERNTIWYDSSVDPWLASYHQAHEYAHKWLRHGARTCSSSDIDSEATEDKIPLGIHRVEGYGSHERMECEANVFASEFLLPGDILKHWFTEESVNAEQIATRTGMSLEMICHQLARSLLTPDIPDSQVEKELQADDFGLDESQTKAAQASEEPILVDAGPGTGKTRTLVGRIVYLLRQGAAPESILVLTFSNKAAEEIRERVGRAIPEAAQSIRVETFHSLGLEWLRKYAGEISLPSKPTVLDPVDALFFLEKSLPELGLDHYQNLYEPTVHLQDVLQAISRAKDENADPARYLELSEAMYKAATTSEGQVAAEKAAEVARVYEFYQNYLEKNRLLDFGDLICRSITLLSERKNVKAEIRQTYQHVLVDEYQDVNRASGLLLKEIVGTGKGLWVVGDVRQSIHRWRGASPANIRLFSTDFPDAKDPLHLEINYRSQPPIVDTFAEFVPHMRATQGAEFTTWKKHRTHDGGRVSFEIASDRQAEAKGIAQEIKRLRAAGVTYREQAVICRSHINLVRIAQMLEKEEVPVLYLGDFFERPEVRDMLSILALACEGDGRGLFRIARFPEYNIPLVDVQALRSLAREQNIPFPQALALAADTEGITPHGKEKIALLARQIDDLCHGRSAWKLLTRYLFVRSKYLDPSLSDKSVSGQQRRVALYQFLQFAHSQLGRSEEVGVDPKLSLLRYIRRLEIYGEEKQLRQVPSWADGLDAVRVLTVHASKGLEFRAVYLPVLGTTYFPANKQHQPCPPPTGLISGGEQDWHQEEEECLFFVAMSRARDYLCLSRAARYGSVNRKPSRFLPLIAAHLPRSVDGAATWLNDDAIADDSSSPDLINAPIDLPVVPEQRLDVYMKCPRKYFYEFVIGLSGKREDSAYVQFHHCVYDVLRHLQSERALGHEVDRATAYAYLDEVWKAKGPLDHFYEPIYRQRAKQMIDNALSRTPPPNSRSAQLEHEIKLPHGIVKLTLDYTELVEDGSESHLLVQRIRTGRPTQSEDDKPIYALYQMAASQSYPQAKRQLQILYLSTNEIQEVTLSNKQLDTRLTNYDKAIIGIRRRRFAPEPSDRECPRCPHYFICPMAEG